MLKKVETKFNVIYLYDILDNITSDQLSYNFPGATFPKEFSTDTIFSSIRDAIKEEAEIDIAPSSKFFIRFDGREFVLSEGTSRLSRAIAYLKDNGHNFHDDEICIDRCDMLEFDSRRIYELDEDYSYDFELKPAPELNYTKVTEPSTTTPEPLVPKKSEPKQEEDSGICFRVTGPADEDIYDPLKKPKDKKQVVLRYNVVRYLALLFRHQSSQRFSLMM